MTAIQPAQRTAARVAIVGCGFIGSRAYAPALSADPCAELVAACDADPVALGIVGQRYPEVRRFPSLDELLASGLEIDMVVNATPAEEHEPVNRAALEAGIHVYSEKPIATTRAGACSLRETAVAQDVQLVAAPDTTTKAWFQALAALVDAGRIGVVHSVAARITEAYSSDVSQRSGWRLRMRLGGLADIGIYPLTELTALCGPVRQVAAMLGRVVEERRLESGQAVRVENDDVAHVLLRFEDGTIGSVEASLSNGVHEDYLLEVRGTEGLARVRGKEPSGIELLRRGEPERRTTLGPPEPWCGGAALFAAHLAGGPRPPMTLDHAVHVAEVLDACHHAAATASTRSVMSSFDKRALRQPARRGAS